MIIINHIFDLVRILAKLVKTILLFNFWIVATMFFQLIGEAFKIQALRMLKPLPIIMMICYIWLLNRPTSKILDIVMVGLCCSLIGDLLLMMDGMIPFMVGALFFMLTHILYVAAFLIGQNFKEMRGDFKIMRGLGYLIVWVALAASVSSLWPNLPFKIVFLIYALVLAVQGTACLYRYERSSQNSFALVFVGVVLFISSENIYAYLKFNQIKVELGSFAVMLTYYGAQFFIMYGILAQRATQSEDRKQFTEKQRMFWKRMQQKEGFCPNFDLKSKQY